MKFTFTIEDQLKRIGSYVIFTTETKYVPAYFPEFEYYKPSTERNYFKYFFMYVFQFHRDLFMDDSCLKSNQHLI